MNLNWFKFDQAMQSTERYRPKMTTVSYLIETWVVIQVEELNQKNTTDPTVSPQIRGFVIKERGR